MGIEFRLGRNDHKVTEDFLGSGSRVVDAITVEAHNAVRQADAIEVARDAGIGVNVDLLLDRLQNPGFDYGPLPYLSAEPVRFESLAGNASERRRLTDEAIAFQVRVGANLVAPHLHSDDERHDDLNLAMAEHAVAMAGTEPVRVIVASNRDRLANDDYAVARHLADALASFGVASIELRLSPTGNKDMSVAKIRSILNV